MMDKGLKEMTVEELINKRNEAVALIEEIDALFGELRPVREQGRGRPLAGQSQREQLLDYSDLRNRGIRLSRHSIWRLCREGKFPRPAKVSGKRNLWVEREIDGYLADKIAARESIPVKAGGSTIGVKPKYRGPNGEEWCGRGATARWLRGYPDHSIFLIAGDGTTPYERGKGDG